jgi:hypothetical protein
MTPTPAEVQALADWLGKQLQAPRRPASMPRRNRGMLEEATNRDGELMRAYQNGVQTWGQIGGLFPGRPMPGMDLLRKGQTATAESSPRPNGWAESMCLLPCITPRRCSTRCGIAATTG